MCESGIQLTLCMPRSICGFLTINTTGFLSWVFLAFTVNSALFIHCTYPKGPISNCSIYETVKPEPTVLKAEWTDKTDFLNQFVEIPLLAKAGLDRALFEISSLWSPALEAPGDNSDLTIYMYCRQSFDVWLKSLRPVATGAQSLHSSFRQPPSPWHKINNK
jgi:hypothetical protein